MHFYEDELEAKGRLSFWKITPNLRDSLKHALNTWELHYECHPQT
jgi:hypothetical protein